ncbi:hypothetical protein Hanom_Chr00s000003g01605061 [Helianthus anomalus]
MPLPPTCKNCNHFKFPSSSGSFSSLQRLRRYNRLRHFNSQMLLGISLKLEQLCRCNISKDSNWPSNFSKS